MMPSTPINSNLTCQVEYPEFSETFGNKLDYIVILYLVIDLKRNYYLAFC